MNSISSLHLLGFFSSQYFALCVFPVFFHPAALSPPCFFFEYFIRALLCHGGHCLLPAFVITDWLGKLCISSSVFPVEPALSFSICHPLTSCRGPGSSKNNPPKMFLNICPHGSDFWCPYSLMVLLQARRLSCSADHLLLDWGCFSSEQL